MAVGDLVTHTGQYEFTTPDGRSLLMGWGTLYRVLTVQGLLSIPEMKVKDQERDGAHGSTYGEADYMTARKLIFELAVEDAPHLTVEPLLDEFYNVFQALADEGTLVMQRDNKNKRMVKARVRRAEMIADYDTRMGLAKGGLELICSDPRVYELEGRDYAAELPEFVGGRSYPLIYPRTYGSVMVGGLIELDHFGNIDNYPVLRIKGPVTVPRVTNVITEEYVQWNGAVGPDDWLEFNHDLHTITLNGQGNVRASLDSGSSWWPIRCNRVNELRFTAWGSEEGSELEILDWRPSWASA